MPYPRSSTSICALGNSLLSSRRQHPLSPCSALRGCLATRQAGGAGGGPRTLDQHLAPITMACLAREIDGGGIGVRCSKNCRWRSPSRPASQLAPFCKAADITVVGILGGDMTQRKEHRRDGKIIYSAPAFPMPCLQVLAFSTIEHRIE